MVHDARATRWSSRVVEIEGYVSEEVLSRQDMTCTIRGRRGSDGAPVDLLVLDPKLTRHDAQETAFLERGQKALAIRHPNIAAVLDVGTDAATGLHYVAAERVEGRTLGALLEDEGQLDELDALAIGQALCDALACVEEADLVHGGVSPATVTIDPDSAPRLAAIGFGCRLSGGSTTRSAAITDESYYTAPERGSAIGDDVRSDLYAVGVLLYRMLTGVLPFGGAQSLGDLVELRERYEVPGVRERAPDASEGTGKVIAWLVTRDPKNRYQSAREAGLDVVRVMTGQDPEGPTRALRGRDTLSFKAADARMTDSAYWGRGAAYAFKVTVASRDVVLDEYVFNQSAITIGRSPNNDVPIDNPIVSRRHAEIQRHGSSGFTLVALSSTNPTELKGRRVKTDAPLDPGATFVLSEKFHVTVDWAPGAAAPEEARVTQERADTVIGPAPGADPATKPNQTAPQSEADAGWAAAPGSLEAEAESHAADAYAADAYAADPYAADPYAADPYAGAEALPAAEEWREPEPSLAESSPVESSRAEAPAHLPGPAGAHGYPRGALVYMRSGVEVRSGVDRGFQVGASAVCDLRLPRGAPRKVVVVIRCVDGYRLYNVAEDASLVTLNGEPVPDQVVLEDGDQIAVAGVELEFRVGR